MTQRFNGINRSRAVCRYIAAPIAIAPSRLNDSSAACQLGMSPEKNGGIGSKSTNPQKPKATVKPSAPLMKTRSKSQSKNWRRIVADVAPNALRTRSRGCARETPQHHVHHTQAPRNNVVKTDRAEEYFMPSVMPEGLGVLRLCPDAGCFLIFWIEVMQPARPLPLCFASLS